MAERSNIIPSVTQTRSTLVAPPRSGNTISPAERKPPGSELAVRKLVPSESPQTNRSPEHNPRTVSEITIPAAPKAQCIPKSWTEVIEDPVWWADLRGTIIEEDD
jgi:hypothetical protein